MRFPVNVPVPEIYARSVGGRRRSDNAVSDLPHPDSPTIATRPCSGTEKLTSRTGTVTCPSRRNAIRRFLTSKSMVEVYHE